MTHRISVSLGVEHTQSVLEGAQLESYTPDWLSYRGMRVRHLLATDSRPATRQPLIMRIAS